MPGAPSFQLSSILFPISKKKTTSTAEKEEQLIFSWIHILLVTLH